MSFAFAALATLETSNLNPEFLQNPDQDKTEQTTSLDAQPTPEQSLRGILQNIRPKENDSVLLAGWKPTGNPFFKCYAEGCWQAVERVNSSPYLPGNMKQELLEYCQENYGSDAKLGYATPFPIRFCWENVDRREEA